MHLSCPSDYIFVGIIRITAILMKMAVFWIVAPCSLVKVCRCFGGACCLYYQDDEWRPAILIKDFVLLSVNAEMEP
jgi:hypothetical protein